MSKRISVTLEVSGLSTHVMDDWPSMRRGRGPLQAPICTSSKAWETALRSGVPSNAVAELILDDNAVFSPKSPTVWSLRVDGHDEFRREIDALTCALVKSWGR